MRAGLGTSLRLTVEEAAEEAVLQARRRIGGRPAGAAIVVATAAWGARALPDLVAAVEARLGDAATVGGSVDALLAGEGWVAHRPALAVLLLDDVDAIELHAEVRPGDEGRVGAEWAGLLEGAPRPGDLLLLFVDALGVAPAPLLAGLARALPGLPVVGIGASDPAGERARVWAGGEVAGGGACAALLVRARRAPEIAVTQGCRVVGGPVEVTRASGPWLRGLDGRPALDVLRGLGLEVGAEGRIEGAARLVGVLDRAAPGSSDDGIPVIRTVRPIVGIDEARGSVSLPEPVAPGARLALLCLDPEAAERDVAARVGAAPGAGPEGPFAPACAIHLSCRAAGDLLLEAAVQSRALAARLAGAPLLGLSSVYPIAPAPSPSAPAEVHTHAGVIALLA